MEELFEILGDSQIRRSELYIAWDFTVASENTLTGRMLSIRDRAFAELGDTNLADGVVQGSSPEFTIDTVTDYTPTEDDRIARQVEGTMTVPCFLTANCAPAGAQFNFTGSSDGQPVQGPSDTEFTFICRIPRATLGGPMATGVRPSLYGHGLLGSGTEVGGGNVRRWPSSTNDDVRDRLVRLRDPEHREHRRDPAGPVAASRCSSTARSRASSTSSSSAGR